MAKAARSMLCTSVLAIGDAPLIFCCLNFEQPKLVGLDSEGSECCHVSQELSNNRSVKLSTTLARELKGNDKTCK